MLRFNNTRKIHLFLLKTISIHLMLRFNGFISNIRHSLFIFQYILCYGSTSKLYQHACRVYRFQYILCYGSTVRAWQFWQQEEKISIHLMLRFNLPHLSAAVFAIIFQYILCYGSTLVISNIDVCRTKFQYILCYGSTNPTLDLSRILR